MCYHLADQALEYFHIPVNKALCAIIQSQQRWIVAAALDYGVGMGIVRGERFGSSGDPVSLKRALVALGHDLVFSLLKPSLFTSLS